MADTVQKSSDDSLQGLWEHSRIVIRYPSGDLQFKEDNFNKILKSVSLEKRKLHTSLAAIIGPTGSGKSFYTNLLVHYLRSEGKRGWLTNILKGNSEKNSALKGFSYGIKPHKISGLSPDNGGSGIYMYPEPFFDRNIGEETILWILHLHGPIDHFEEKLDSMEALLILICSKMTEIIWNTDKLTVSKLREICSEDVLEKQEFCQNITFLNRTSAVPSTTIIEDEKEVLSKLKEIEPTLNESFLRAMECLNITNVPNCAEPLHDNSGKLTMTTEFMKILHKCIRQIGDDIFSVKCAKKEEPLLLEKLGGYLASKVALVNHLFRDINTRRILQFEESISRICHETIQKEYRKSLQMIIERGPLHLQHVHLDNMHQLLVQKYMLSLKRAQKLPPSFANYGSDVDNTKFMENDMREAFQHFKIENSKMVQAKCKELLICISTCTRKYKEAIGQVILENPRGVERRTLKELHEDTQTKVKAELRKELSEKKFALIEISKSITTLQIHIDEAWIEFEERNVDGLKSRAKDSAFEIKKRAQMEQLKQQQRERDNFNNTGESSNNNTMQGSSTTAIKEGTRGPVSDAPKKKSQPPLIFQLTLSKILTGVPVASKSKQEGLDLTQIFPTPALVGVTKNGIWLFGVEVEKQLQSTGDSPFQQVWKIGDCLTENENGKWSQEITLLEAQHKITVEFLLGLLLHFLKEKMEAELKGEISTAIIIIPFWTASSQRKWIKDAGKIAGFRSVVLLNENTAIAWAQAKLLRKNTSKLVILSENSGQVDATAYLYDKTASSGEELHMIGHGYAYLNKLVAVTQAFEHAVTKFGSIDGAVVFVSYESPDWINTLSKVGLRFCQSLGDVRDLQIGMEGALWFCRSIGDANGVRMEHCRMTEWMSYDILRCPIPDGKPVVSQSREEVQLQIDPLEVTAPLRLNRAEVSFCQSTVNGDILIGRFAMRGLARDTFEALFRLVQVNCILQVEQDGIISLKSVEECRRLPPPYGLLPLNLSKREVSQTDYDWITPHLTEEEVVVLHSLVEPLFKGRAADAAKHKLAERAEMMLSRIRNDEGSFRSEVAKDMIIAQIKGIIELVSHPKFSDIEKQTAVIDGISQKYLNE